MRAHPGTDGSRQRVLSADAVGRAEERVDAPERFSIRARLRSFRNAWRGVRAMLVREHNSRIHALAAVAVVLLGLFLDVSLAGWCWLILAIVLVLGAEAFNTALEALADATAPDPHPLVERAKDTAAGGVLLVAVGAACIGFLVLGPPLWAWLSGG